MPTSPDSAHGQTAIDVAKIRGGIVYSIIRYLLMLLVLLFGCVTVIWFWSGTSIPLIEPLTERVVIGALLIMASLVIGLAIPFLLLLAILSIVDAALFYTDHRALSFTELRLVLRWRKVMATQ